MNFTIMIIVIKTPQFLIISDFVIIWKSIAYLQFKECLFLFYSLLYVCYLNFGVLFALELMAFHCKLSQNACFFEN